MTDVEALYRQHASAVYRFALSLSGDRATAEDLTSETFVRLWTARDRLDLTTVLGYLLTITRHLYLQGRRHQARRSDLLEDPTDHGRREAITQYRSIIVSYPKNSNAFRALWRVGDLYV